MQHNYIAKILILVSLCSGSKLALTHVFEQLLSSSLVLQNISNIKGINHSSIVFADVDGDSDQDVLITGSDKFGIPFTRLYKKDGSGIYTEVIGTPFEEVQYGSIAFADIDGDGDQDVVITGRDNSNNRIARLYENDGFGNFTEVINSSLVESHQCFFRRSI